MSISNGLGTNRVCRSNRRFSGRLRGKLWRALRRRRSLHRQVHGLRREVARLREDNRALAQRNEAVERLSAELMRFNIDLSQASRLDPMTGLLNRAAFEACLAQEHALTASAAEAGRERPYSVILIDVDYFKSFNDTYGHPEGDRCLVAVARSIQSAVRQTDFVGRYGGEEIVVLCPGSGKDAAKNLAERLRESVSQLNIQHAASDVSPFVTISLGLASTGELGLAYDKGSEVVLAADRVLYQAKRAGRNQVVAA